jgi:hypothetical protein
LAFLIETGLPRCDSELVKLVGQAGLHLSEESESGVDMRAFKVAMVALTMTASLVAGAAATASDGPSMTSSTRWCC